MKLLRLDLRAFGPFDGLALDFPDPGPGLHLIQGPNEAGKSSALRALRCLLFGFPHVTGDNHRHKYADLRVGATLRAADGRSLEFVRRKGQAKTLRGADDEAPLPDDALAPFLGTVGADRFQALYMSDLGELIAGGRDLIAGKGDLGSILFGAGGLSRLPEVRRLLEAEAEGLFKKGAAARNPRINNALAQLELARKSARDRSLAPAEWDEVDRARKAAHDRLGALDATLAALDADRRRLDRLGRALPLLAARREATARLGALGDVPRLPEGFDGRRIDAVAARSAARETARAARLAIASIEEELASIDPPDRLLAEAPAVAALREEWGALRKGRDLRPKRLDAAARAEAAAGALLRDLDPGRTLDRAESLRLGKARRDRIKTLGLERSALEAEAARAVDEARALAQALLGAPGPDGPEARRGLGDLDATVKRVERRGDLEAARARAAAEARRLEAEAEAALARLPRWSGGLDDLASRPVPLDPAVARLEEALASAEAGVSNAEAALLSNRAELAAIDDRAERDRLLGDGPPSEADLSRARAARDGGWRSVRRAWLDAPSPAADPGLAAAYEHLVNHADSLADGLRREAGRVAEQSAVESRRGRLVEHREALGRALDDARAALERARSEWSVAWHPAGVEPGPPAEMRAWRAAHRDLLARAEAIRSARLQAGLASEAVAEARRELDAALVALGEPPAGPAAGPAALLDRARDLIDRGEVARAHGAALARMAVAESRLAAWRARWGEAVGPLGLGAESSPEVALEAIERLDALFARLDEAGKARREADAIEAEAARYARDVAELARRVGRDPGEGAPEAVAEALVAALADAQRDDARRASATARLEAERARLDQAERSIRDRDALLDALCRQAGVDDPDGLPEVERRAAEAARWREKLDEAEGALVGLGGGAGVDELAGAALGIDPDALPARLAGLAERIDALRSDRDAANREVGGLQERLASMDGRADAATADGEARHWLAAIEADVEQYARLRLASAVLRRAIERYRERRQGPILARLGALFAELTAGAFAGVALDESEPESDGRPVLVGLRPGSKGGRVPVEGMSEGTADALYLAVRLATLDSHLDDHEAMPFVVDDILVHFDDDRARAALGALARLSGRAQVLFFTHHEHLVTLARAALPPPSWRLHRLSARGAGGEG